ncbi:MAG: EAL domain-containing protein [Acidobacteriota bacterium]
MQSCAWTRLVRRRRGSDTSKWSQSTITEHWVPRADLPWHQRLEARVASALGLLVAVALGAVLFVTVGVVSSQSREREAGNLEVARSAFHRLLDLRIASAIDVAELVMQAPALRAQLSENPSGPDRAVMTALAGAQRKQMAAAFTIVAGPQGSWLGTAGWADQAGSGASVVRDAQHTALRGQPTGALVQDQERLFLVVSVPARAGNRVLGTLTAGYQLTDEIATDLARLARCEVALVAHGRVVATSLRAQMTQNADAVVRATLDGPGVRPDVLVMGDRQYVGGVFPLESSLPGGDNVRLLVLSDWAATQQFIDALRGRFALAGVVAVALSLIGGVFLAHHLSRPLRDIATAATEIAAGNLSLQLPVRGTAEAATVAQAFNAMSVSLRTAHERLVHDAIHDHLTQLPNRAHFKGRLDKALARRQRRKDYQFAVLFVDLDRFKHVNDSLGHTAGDRLLVMFAERLAAAVRAEDVVSRMPGSASLPEPTLARFGGDEFAVLLDGIREPLDAVRVAKRVQQMAAQPLPLDGQDVFASASIGVAVATDAHTSSEDIIRDADLAMYRAKHSGAGGYSVFDAALHDEAVRRLRLETDLRHAVERREFRVWYQPIVSLSDHVVVGAEALVRWQHPERGLLSPGDFFDVAEEVGLITQIDDFVLKESCRQMQAWLHAGVVPSTTTVSVNLSAKAFAQEALVQHVAGILHATNCPPAALRLEITEGAAIKDAVRARVVLAQLRALGVRISLDDFGTGYSSLSYLQSLPLDTLKIDRSFVAGIGTDKDKGEIVKLIVGLARTLDLEIVAEGTETASQVDYLRRLGCQFGQGYFFARPAEAVGPTPLAVTVSSA